MPLYCSWGKINPNQQHLHIPWKLQYGAVKMEDERQLRTRSFRQLYGRWGIFVVTGFDFLQVISPRYINCCYVTDEHNVGPIFDENCEFHLTSLLKEDVTNVECVVFSCRESMLFKNS